MLVASFLLLLPSLCFSHPGSIDPSPRRALDALHLPLYRNKISSLKPRGSASPIATIGLGDFQDVTYSVMVNIGGTEIQLVLDTGSSDLWVASTACKVQLCDKVMTLYPQTNFQPANVAAHLFYGDSMTGTFASGEIGTDVVGIAGLAIQNQFFAAINDTNTTAPQTGSSGIIGFGFPINSVIWSDLLQAQFPSVRQYHPKRSLSVVPALPGRRRAMDHVSRDDLSPIESRSRTPFPDLAFHLSEPNGAGAKRQSMPPSLNDVLNSFGRNGPLISRLAQSGLLPSPQFSITLQRDAIQIGGNVGMLSLGGLPRGVTNESLTWVDIRQYTAVEGGLNSSTDTYPIAWEVPLDAVFIDGHKLPRPTLPPGIGMTALMDTGSSLIRGPKDVVSALMAIVTGSSGGTTFDCSVPHNLTFQIGGLMLPVDPRDFMMSSTTARACQANIVATDPPRNGFLYSWSLGDPFLKSVLASFYFGNITHPSVDPARVGFMSTVTSDAGTQLKSAVAAAQANGGMFSVTTQEAPGGNTISTTITGVAESTTMTVATAAVSQQPSGARRRVRSVWRRWTSLGLVSAVVSLYAAW